MLGWIGLLVRAVAEKAVGLKGSQSATPKPEAAILQQVMAEDDSSLASRTMPSCSIVASRRVRNGWRLGRMIGQRDSISTEIVE